MAIALLGSGLRCEHSRFEWKNVAKYIRKQEKNDIALDSWVLENMEIRFLKVVLELEFTIQVHIKTHQIF